MVVKNLGISILMFIFLVGFAFSIDVMRGLEVKEALKNMMSTFRVLGKGRINCLYRYFYVSFGERTIRYLSK